MRYDLVFEGGGAKGIVFIGALQAFEANGVEFGRLLGTSSGAIPATLLAAGFDALSIYKSLNEPLANGQSHFASMLDIPTDFDPKTLSNSRVAELLDRVRLPLLPEAIDKQLDRRLLKTTLRIPLFRQFFSLTERGGLYAGDVFLEWIQNQLNANGRGLANATFAEFYDFCKCDLSITATDTTDQRLLVLNHKTAPDMPVAWAVRASTSIPFLWQEVVWQDRWGSYNDKPLGGHVLVDGGVLSNFPIELFLSQDPFVTDLMGDNQGAKVLGCLIDESLPLEADSAELEDQIEIITGWSGAIRVGRSATLHRILNLINTMTTAHDKMVFDHYRHLVARLPAKGYGTTEFDMSQTRIERLITSGRRAMNNYLRQSQPMAVGELAPHGLTSIAPSTQIDDIARRILAR